MTRMVELALLTACGLLLAAPARAGQIEELARQAEAKAAAGQPAEGLELLRQAMATMAAETPLGFRRISFIAEPPKGFGLYKPRAEASFRKGEPLAIYAEPVGLAWKSEGEQFHALLTVDFELRAPDGQILTGQKEFGRFAFDSRERNLEIMTHLTLNLSGAPAGKYVFGATYHDKTSGKQASFDLPFEIK